jgi:hypothetical protein
MEVEKTRRIEDTPVRVAYKGVSTADVGRRETRTEQDGAKEHRRDLQLNMVHGKRERGGVNIGHDGRRGLQGKKCISRGEARRTDISKIVCNMWKKVRIPRNVGALRGGVAAVRGITWMGVSADGVSMAGLRYRGRSRRLRENNASP